MTTSTDLCYLSIAEAAGGLRRKEYSPVDLARACLDRILALDGRLHSFITVTEDLALDQANRAEQELAAGKDRGPLHGIPIALKDLYDTRGIRTTAHSRLFRDRIPDQDATAAARLAEAGTVLLGKLAMHEFASGSPALDGPFPPARNPWNLDHIPGGSSSGSGTALAAGLCLGSLGSDTGGSIRGPAAHCGIAGLKPTYGRVSRAGVVPVSWSLDHAGPMARSVKDCALLLQAIAGHDATDPASADVPVPDYRASLGQGIAGLRLGVPRQRWFNEAGGADAEVVAAFDAALKVLAGLGASLVELDGQPFARVRGVNQTILDAERYAYHEEWLQRTPELYGSWFRRRVLAGAFLSAADYIQAQRARSALNAAIRANFTRVEAFATPTMAQPPASFARLDSDETNRGPSFTGPFNLTGLPAISVPCGFTASGLPIGLQVAGRPFDEPTIFRIAHIYEQATPWHQRRPSLP